MVDKASLLEALQASELAIYKQKNADYGDSFAKSFQEYGLTMACIRLEDKLNRLKSFCKTGEFKVVDESVKDTLMDLANYANMTLLEYHLANIEKGGDTVESEGNLC